MKRLAALALVLVIVAIGCQRTETEIADKTSARSATGPTSVTAASKETEARLDVGSTMPEYSAVSLDGSKFNLADHRGKVVLLNLWATWCGPCRYEIPELQSLHDRYKGKGFEVVGVSIDEGGAEAVREFVDEQKMTYPVVLDPEGKLANIMETSVLPTTVLLDRDGKVVWKKMGAVMPNDTELEQSIEKSL